MLLPYRKLELFSPLRPGALAEALGEEVEPKKWPRRAPSRRFEGTVTETGFDVSRAITYRNSFLPRLKGTFVPDGPGCRISLTMGLHPGTLVFLVVWAGIAVLGGVAYAASAVTQGGPFSAVLIPLGMLLFGWAIVMGSFWFEARKSEALLCSITGAQRTS